MLQRYPEPKDWQRVRFSDEVQFGWPWRGYTYHSKAWTTVLPWLYSGTTWARRKKTKGEFIVGRQWGHNFKSPTYISTIPAILMDGKMKQEVSIHQPDPRASSQASHGWRPVMIFCVRGRQRFRPRSVQANRILFVLYNTWKEKNGLENYYFNLCSFTRSRSYREERTVGKFLTPIHTRKYPHLGWWDLKKALVVEGWAQVSPQRFINEKVAEIFA